MVIPGECNLAADESDGLLLPVQVPEENRIGHLISREPQVTLKDGQLVQDVVPGDAGEQVHLPVRGYQGSLCPLPVGDVPDNGLKLARAFHVQPARAHLHIITLPARCSDPPFEELRLPGIRCLHLLNSAFKRRETVRLNGAREFPGRLPDEEFPGALNTEPSATLPVPIIPRLLHNNLSKYHNITRTWNSGVRAQVGIYLIIPDGSDDHPRTAVSCDAGPAAEILRPDAPPAGPVTTVPANRGEPRPRSGP